MSLTAYGIEQMLDGPDPQSVCGDWDTIRLLDDTGTVFATVSATPSRPQAGVLTLSGTYDNGAGQKTLSKVQLHDGTDVCKEDAIGEAIAEYQSVDLVVNVNASNAA